MSVQPGSAAADEIVALVNELADLIGRVERASIAGTPATVRQQIKHHEAATSRIMARLGAAINDFLAAAPSADLVAQTQALVTSRLRAWSSSSPLFYHVFNTPRKKLGPYEVFDLLLEKRSGGADAAGQMLDHYYMNTAASAAFRLRNELLTRKLAIEIRRRAAEHPFVRLLNLHTGSGQELLALVRDHALRAVMQVTCLDTDASVIRRMKQQLGPALSGRASFQFSDARKIFQAPTWPAAPYDLIYALVLFDQLSNRQIESLIAGCYRWLRPSGALIFGNYAMSMPDDEHTIIHWVLNLNIRRRSEEELRSIFARTPFGAQAVSCELDALGASWLVIAERI